VPGLEQLEERGVGHLVHAGQHAGVILVVRCHVEDTRLRGDAEFSFRDTHADTERTGLDLFLFRKPGEGLAADLERGEAERRAFLRVGELGREGAHAREGITWHESRIRRQDGLIAS